MSELVAKTVFMTGPDDSVAAADVYQKPSEAPVNNGKTVVQTSTAPNPTPDKINPKDIVKRAPESAKNAIDKVKNITGDVAGMSSTFVEKLKEGVSPKEGLKAIVAKGKMDLKGAGMAAGKDLIGKDTMMVIDGVQSIRKTGDFDSAAGVMGVLNTISNNPSFAKIDFIGDKLGALGAIANKLTALRIPQIIDTVLDKIEREKDKKRFLVDNLETFIKNSDLYSVNLALNKAGRMACLAKVPNAVVLLLTYYKLPNDTDYPTMAVANELNDTLNRFDTKWHETKRRGVWISNLEPFASCNPQALQALSRLPQYRVPTLMAKSHLTKDIMDMAREAFPKAAFKRQ